MFIAHVNLARGIRGGENQTLALIEGLKKAGVPQKLVCRAGDALEQRARAIEGLEIVAIRKPFLWRLGAFEGCSLIHVHEGRGVYMALAAKWFKKIPYLITRRIPNPPKNTWLGKMAYRNAACIVSLSGKIDSVMREYTKGVGRFEIIPSIARKLVADSEKVAAIKARFPGKTIIGHIGALSDHHKNQSLIIEAARQLADRKELVFMLVGSGRDEAMLKAKAADLSNVVFEGFQPEPANYYAAFDLFVYPSKEEGLGSAILEAFGFGLPVIAADVDGIPDIIQDGGNGVLIDPVDAKEFRNKIVLILDDRSLCRKIQEGGRASLSLFAEGGLAGRYRDLYQELDTGS